MRNRGGIYTTETERAYPMSCVSDKNGEYSYLITECGNKWYSVETNPMWRDGCLCPKCGRTIKVVM